MIYYLENFCIGPLWNEDLCTCMECVVQNSCTVTSQLSDGKALHTCKEIIIINPLFLITDFEKNSYERD